ncbi:hypothetical protein GPECTOR_10g773 [Gonium pectorale]|uniref:Uncharacterized protein n=1 Tax=Gonium pectorale TaxID=33097 RepID=A0A150GQS4_GONPE|nr:hypothetical protein GPECTOR_10g773 [Gonium pectorale]|eukprot:KXZ52144.1 hypothetical protein GPECTOR_10g773 [Gonium pectorale]
MDARGCRIQDALAASSSASDTSVLLSGGSEEATAEDPGHIPEREGLAPATDSTTSPDAKSAPLVGPVAPPAGGCLPSGPDSNEPGSDGAAQLPPGMPETATAEGPGHSLERENHAPSVSVAHGLYQPVDSTTQPDARSAPFVGPVAPPAGGCQPSGPDSDEAGSDGAAWLPPGMPETVVVRCEMGKPKSDDGQLPRYTYGMFNTQTFQVTCSGCRICAGQQGAITANTFMTKHAGNTGAHDWKHAVHAKGRDGQFVRMFHFFESFDAAPVCSGKT